MSLLFATIESLLDWGVVKATSLSDSLKEVVATIRGAEDVESGLEETIDGQNLSIVSAIVERPRAPTSDGSYEVLFVRRGDEAVPLSTRDVRDLPQDVEEGEVVVRDLAGQGTTIRLKPNGDVHIVASGDILLGSEVAAKALALAEKVDNNFTSFVADFNAHTHPFVATGATSPTSPPSVPLSGYPATASTKVKASE